MFTLHKQQYLEFLMPIYLCFDLLMLSILALILLKVTLEQYDWYALFEPLSMFFRRENRTTNIFLFSTSMIITSYISVL